MEGPFLWEEYDHDSREGVSQTLRTLPRERWLAVDKRGRSLLHRACQYGNLPAVRTLIREGACVNAGSIIGDGWAFRPIEIAIHGNQWAIVEWLCAAGAHLFPRTIGAMSPLFMALAFEYGACAAILIANGLRLRDVERGGFITNALRLFEKGVLRCRSMAAVMMGVKRHRGGHFQHVDRFLFRELALAVWVTRTDDEWQQ